MLQLATRLRANGVNVLLDRWDLTLGKNLASFMEQGLSEPHRVVCICSEAYSQKANDGKGGVGYEKQIITSELIENSNTDWVIPVLRNNQSQKLPTFLRGKLYINFEDDRLYERNYEMLLRELLSEPVYPIPPIGENPFKTIQNFAQQKFIPASERYVSPASKGNVTFDYSNNNGSYFIGQNEMMFELKFSKSSDANIHLYNDPNSIHSIAVVKDKDEITDITDARTYDSTSRCRCPKINQIAVIQNTNRFHAAIKILDVKDDTRGSKFDEVTFEYIIQTNGSPDFTTLKPND